MLILSIINYNSLFHLIKKIHIFVRYVFVFFFLILQYFVIGKILAQSRLNFVIPQAHVFFFCIYKLVIVVW